MMKKINRIALGITFVVGMMIIMGVLVASGLKWTAVNSAGNYTFDYSTNYGFDTGTLPIGNWTIAGGGVSAGIKCISDGCINTTDSTYGTAPNPNNIMNGSISFWIRPNDITTTQMITTSGGAGTALPGHGISISGGLLSALFDGGGSETTTVIPITRGVWTHFLIKVNSSGIIIFRNGTAVNTTAHAGAGFFRNGTTHEFIGSAANPITANTTLDEIKWFNTELTEAQVLDLYNTESQSTTINSVTYNSTTYETSVESYAINITPFNVSITPENITFKFNNTYYTPTSNHIGDTWVLNYSNLDIPLISAATTKDFSFSWNMNGTIETFSYSQTINPLYFYVCNSTFNVSYINISFRDETTLSSINASLASLSVDYYIGDGSLFRSLSLSALAENSSFAFCFSPSFKNLSTNGFNVRAYGTDYPARSFFFPASLTNTTTQKILYLLASADGTPFTIIVINVVRQSIAGAIINLTNSDVGVVGSTTTDDAGSATFFANPNTLHTLNVLASGYDLFTASVTPTSSSPYTVILGSTSSVGVSNLTQCSRGVTTYVKPSLGYLLNKTTYNFNFTLSSSYYSVSSFGINITNGTDLMGTISAATNGGTVKLDLNTGNNKTFVLGYYYIINGNICESSYVYIIETAEGTGWSIANFFTDLVGSNGSGGYLASGIFGLKRGFALNIILFLVIFLTAGIFSWRYGLYNPIIITGIIFSLVFLFDAALGLVDPGNLVILKRGVPTIIAGILLFLVFLKEGTGY